jgi:hypothetical protein
MPAIPARLALGAILLLGATPPHSAPRHNLEVRFSGGDVTLSGTLSVPGGPVRRRAVAVFVSGDGPQDRDGNPGGASLFRVLAESLVAHGIVVLRHDDRGAGLSSAPTGAASYRSLIGDTRTAIAFVRKRAECDPRRVVLVGHSEGAGTCAVLAAEDTSIAGIALLAGATAVNVDTLLEEQARFSPDGPAPRLLPTLARAKAGEDARAPGDLVLWMREHLEIAPRSVLPRIRCPALILQGEADHLVRPHHAAEAAALIESGGNRRVTIRTFPGLSHVFNRRVPGVAASPDAARVDPTVGETLARWADTLASR